MHKTMEDENMNQTSLTGVPSADRPWMQYYPEMLRGSSGLHYHVF